MGQPDDVRAWVRTVDGKLVLTFQSRHGGEWTRGGTRRLTLLERIHWRLTRKVPEP